MIWVFLGLGLMAYIAIAGYVGGRVANNSYAACGRCTDEDKRRGTSDCGSDHIFNAFLAGAFWLVLVAFWVVAAPFVGAFFLGVQPWKLGLSWGDRKKKRELAQPEVIKPTPLDHHDPARFGY